MDLQQLATFAAVAKHHSLTKASAELGTSQPTVSRSLRLFQEQCGARLIQRESKGVSLTAAGQAILRRIQPILDQMVALQSELTPAAAKKAGQVLKVGGTFSASTRLLPELLARMRQRYPDAQLEIRTRISDQLERLVARSTMDLAVIARVASSPELICEPFLVEKVALFVLADHPLAKQRNLTLADILAEPLVLRGGRGAAGATDRQVEALRASGATVKIAIYCDEPTAIKAAVRQRMGVGVVLAAAIQAEVASGEFKILNPPSLDLVGQSYIVYPKNRPLSPMAQVFLRMLRAERARGSSAKMSYAPVSKAPLYRKSS